MKEIINGKMYNTETAEQLGYYRNGFFPGDFKYYEEDLFLKKTGKYFLAGKGGGLSKYNTFREYAGITPLTVDEAMQWAEKCLDADSYIELFGEPEE